MAAVLLRNVSEHLHLLLVRRARAHRRSVSAEILCLLEEVLSDRAGPPSLSAVDSLRVQGQRPLTQKLLDAARREHRR
jgi:plasmid stability protein